MKKTREEIQKEIIDIKNKIKDTFNLSVRYKLNMELKYLNDQLLKHDYLQNPKT